MTLELTHIRPSAIISTQHKRTFTNLLIGLFILCLAAGTSFAGTKVFNEIEDIPGWGSCDVCSGPGGHGSSNPHWIAQYQRTPSLDGSSAQLHIGGSAPYSDAMWWRQLQPIDSATHFVLDFYIFFNNQRAPQALELDAAQSVNGKRYFFGTECDISGRYAGQWMVNNYPADRWEPTGIPCRAATANRWHHVVWQFERINGRTHYIAVTVDGVRSNVNRYEWPRNVNARELNVAFQLDQTSAATNFSVWVEHVKLTAW